MNDYETLLGWIRAKPALAGIRCDGDDKRIVRIAARAFGTAERTIRSLTPPPSQLEGLDASGGVVRVWNMPVAPGEEPAPIAASKQRQEHAWPAGQAAELGQVIALASDRAAERYEGLAKELGAAYKAAFREIVGLYREQSERLQRLEESLTENTQARIAEAEAIAAQAQADADAMNVQLEEIKAKATAGGGDDLAGFILEKVGGGALRGLLGGGTETPQQNGASNGAKGPGHG